LILNDEDRNSIGNLQETKTQVAHQFKSQNITQKELIYKYKLENLQHTSHLIKNFIESSMGLTSLVLNDQTDTTAKINSPSPCSILYQLINMDFKNLEKLNLNLKLVDKDSQKSFESKILCKIASISSLKRLHLNLLEINFKNCFEKCVNSFNKMTALEELYFRYEEPSNILYGQIED